MLNPFLDEVEMCSSPKNSSHSFKPRHKKHSNQMEQQEFARMVRRASEVFDRIEQQKSLKRLTQVEQPHDDIMAKETTVLAHKANKNAFKTIKSFLLQPVF